MTVIVILASIIGCPMPDSDPYDFDDPNDGYVEGDHALFAEVFDVLHIENPVFGRAYGFGDGDAPVLVPIRGSVINYMFEELDIDQSRMISRPNKITDLKYIIYHDTANLGIQYNGNAEAHALLQYNGGSPSASWHFTVDSVSIYQSIDTDYMAGHAGNSEGNNHSIGIETCVNYGRIRGDYYRTWQRTGKLLAFLLDKYNLQMNQVLSHADISRIGVNMGIATYVKCCPQTLRHAGLWENAKEMAEGELLYLKKVVQEGYEVKFVVDELSTKYIDNKGRVIKLPAQPRKVRYTIELTDPEGRTQQKRYISMLPSEEARYRSTCDIPSCNIGGPAFSFTGSFFAR